MQTTSYLEKTSHAIHPYCHPKNVAQGNGCEISPIESIAGDGAA